MYDVLIIGSGPVGLYAATLSSMQNLKSIIIESSNEFGGTLNLYKEKNISDVPGYVSITAGALISNLYDQYVHQAVTPNISLNTQIISYSKETDYFIVKTTQGDFNTKTVLFCNGGGMFYPRQLELPNKDEFDNIFYFVDKLNQFENKDITILGGGDSAVDFALNLAPFAKSINVVHRRPDFRAHENNVNLMKAKSSVYTPYVINSIEGGTSVKSLTIKHTTTKEIITLKTDALLVFYGNVPIKPDYEKFNLVTNHNLIVVSTNMQTSTPGIYAAGNSVIYDGKIKMISSGMGEAATAISAISKYLNPNKTHTYKH
ncbi:MAG TPA: NAD(P)/FAD-dependent oxidoreductase [Acholeplasma sp.]|nr:NAD(P)/FAD-dependent oxidoreductase [Acholeplasma sp.]